MARIAVPLAALVGAAFLAAPAAAQMFREKVPLSEAERAIVHDWLEGYSAEETALVIGHLEGTDFVSTVADPEASQRDKDRKQVVLELRRELVKPCPEGKGRYLQFCSDLHGHDGSFAMRFYRKYYGDCDAQLASDCR